MRRAWFLLLLGSLAAGRANAQALPPGCYAPDRLGWYGPRGEIGCQPCCGCRGAATSMEWQYRDEDAGWTNQQQTFSVAGRYANRPFPALTHLAGYCTRVRFADSAGPGQWGPSNVTNTCGAGSDVCFTWDDAPPETPVLLDGGVLPGGNAVELHFAPSGDDGGGVARYAVKYLPSNVPAQGTFGHALTSPVSDLLGAGTWSVAVFAEDRAGNASGNSALLTVSLGFDASVAPAGAPAWAQPVTNAPYLDLEWADDGADSWVVTQRGLDGGWFIGARPRVAGASALLGVPGPCRLHSARIARVLGDQVSDWSPPAPDLLADTVAPVPSAPRLAGVDGGAALLSWTPATDECPSGLSYRLERSDNGGPFLPRVTTGNTEAVDALDVRGVLRWRLVAIDGAENVGTSDGVSLTVGSEDGGLLAQPDAGEPDAGEPDGGEPDDAGTVPGAPLRLAVGCGCGGGAELSLVGLLGLLFRRRWSRLSGGP